MIRSKWQIVIPSLKAKKAKLFVHLLLLQPKYLPTASHPEYSRMLFVKYFSKLSGRTLPRQTKCSPLSNIFSSQAGSLSKQIPSHLQKSFSRGVIGQKKSFSVTCSRAAQTASSLYCSRGSRFMRMSPANKTW